MKTKLFLSLVTGTLALAPISRADDTVASPATPAAPVAAPADDAWRFGVTLPGWAPQVNGDITQLGIQRNVSVSFNTLKDHLQSSFGLALDASKGKFGMYADAGYMKFTAGSTAADGSSVAADLKFLVADGGISYLLLKQGEEHPFLLAGTAGLRYWYMKPQATFTGPHGILQFSGYKEFNLADPVIGLRGSQYLTRKLHLDFSGDFGGFDISHGTDITWSAAGVATYDFTKWLNVSAGYKALAADEAESHSHGKDGVNLIFSGVVIAVRVSF